MRSNNADTSITLSQYYLALKIAIQFLTILPVGKLPTSEARLFGVSMSFYPFVGLLLGFLVWSFAALVEAFFPSLLTSILILTLWITLTGALHLDGLADCADAWLGGLGSKNKTLRIMKDPASGPIAVTALVLLVLIKLFAIHALIEVQQIAMIIWPLIIARISAPLLLITTPYVRDKGLGTALSEHSQNNLIWLNVLVSALAMALILGWSSILIIALSAATFLLLRQLMMQRLEGCTGDTVGAHIEITETIVLLTLVALFY